MSGLELTALHSAYERIEIPMSEPEEPLARDRIVLKDSGRQCYFKKQIRMGRGSRLRLSDAYEDVFKSIRNPSAGHPAITGESPATLASRASDIGSLLGVRIAALRALVQCSPSGEDRRLRTLVVSELEQPMSEPRWTQNLVSLAERLDFHDPDERARLAQSLLARATELARGPGADSRAASAAIRRFASLAADSSELELLTPLVHSQVKRLRLASLHAIDAFAANKPLLDAPRGLRDAVSELVEFVLHPAYRAETTEDDLLVVAAIVGGLCIAPVKASEWAACLAKSNRSVRVKRRVRMALQELAHRFSTSSDASSSLQQGLKFLE